nr:mismatch-specific DNA-glycosylase [Gemmatimonadota bacterium]
TASEEHELLPRGYGITNLVERATATAAELSAQELAAGGGRLELKVRSYRPRVVAVLGITAYRSAFGRRGAVLGPQEERIGDALAWVLPNPSGLNAHYRLEDLARIFRELRMAVEADDA